MEMIVVLGALVALTGLVLVNLNPETIRFSNISGDNSIRGVTTQNTMASLRNSLFGDGVAAGYWQDVGAEPDLWPRYLEWLHIMPTAADVYGSGFSSANQTFVSLMSTNNPLSRLGWRGPYFQGLLINLSNRTDVPSQLAPSSKPSGGVYQTPADGWGQPILMVPPTSSLSSWSTRMAPFGATAAQVRDVLMNCRLVSPGANRRFDSLGITNYADAVANPGKAGDDIMLWLRE